MIIMAIILISLITILSIMIIIIITIIGGGVMSADWRSPQRRLVIHPSLSVRALALYGRMQNPITLERSHWVCAKVCDTVCLHVMRHRSPQGTYCHLVFATRPVSGFMMLTFLPVMGQDRLTWAQPVYSKCCNDVGARLASTWNCKNAN